MTDTIQKESAMKKYSICFFAVYCICFLLLYAIYPADENDISAGLEETTVVKREKLTQNEQRYAPGEYEPFSTDGTGIPAAGEVQIPAKGYYSDESKPVYLVYGGISEILICYPDSDTVYKRIPLIPEDLSQEDRDELVHGITFSSIEELYHYLESITS